MACKFMKVILEIGHKVEVCSESIKTRFNHKWELFFRGANNTEIENFVEKIIFYLVGTGQFPFCKRVVNEPPYCIRERGDRHQFKAYIVVCLKNMQQSKPKIIKFVYNLTMPKSGERSFSKVVKRNYCFEAPTGELRENLIKGGAVDDHKPSESRKRKWSPTDPSSESKKVDDHKPSENKKRKWPPSDPSLESKKVNDHKPSESNKGEWPPTDLLSESKKEKALFTIFATREEKLKKQKKEKSVTTTLKSRRDKDCKSNVPLKKIKKDGNSKTSTKLSKKDSKMKSANHKEKQNEKSAEKNATANKKEVAHHKEKQKEKFTEKHATATKKEVGHHKEKQKEKFTEKHATATKKEVAKSDSKKDKDNKQHKVEKLKSKDKYKNNKQENYSGKHNKNSVPSLIKEDTLVSIEQSKAYNTRLSVLKQKITELMEENTSVHNVTLGHIVQIVAQAGQLEENRDEVDFDLTLLDKKSIERIEEIIKHAPLFNQRGRCHLRKGGV